MFDSLEYSIWTIMSSTNKGNLIFFFPICVVFISFSCLITLPRASSTMLNGSFERGNPYLITELGVGRIQFLTVKYDVKCKLFIDVRQFPSILSLVVILVTKWCWILLHTFSILFDMIIWFSVFSVDVMDYSYWFWNVEPTLHS